MNYFIHSSLDVRYYFQLIFFIFSFRWSEVMCSYRFSTISNITSEISILKSTKENFTKHYHIIAFYFNISFKVILHQAIPVYRSVRCLRYWKKVSTTTCVLLCPAFFTNINFQYRARHCTADVRTNIFEANYNSHITNHFQHQTTLWLETN